MEKMDSKEVIKMMSISIFIVGLISAAILLAYHFYGNGFLIIAFLSSPFVIIFGCLIISALAKSKNEEDKQKRINELERRVKELERQ